MQINFFHNEERLVVVGRSDYDVDERGGKVENFSIADDEQLIGCKLDEGSSSICNVFCGLTFLKMKVRF